MITLLKSLLSVCTSELHVTSARGDVSIDIAGIGTREKARRPRARRVRREWQNFTSALREGARSPRLHPGCTARAVKPAGRQAGIYPGPTATT